LFRPVFDPLPEPPTGPDDDPHDLGLPQLVKPYCGYVLDEAVVGVIAECGEKGGEGVSI